MQSPECRRSFCIELLRRLIIQNSEALMFSKTVLPAFVIGMLLLTACQKAEMPVPTEQDGAQVWHDLLKKDHGIELVSFKKTNGHLDGSHYLLDFEAQVRYLDNGIHDPAAAPGVGIRANRKGTVETVKGSYEFQRTENGWKGQDGNVYAFKQ